jgi:hypothetical protein
VEEFFTKVPNCFPKYLPFFDDYQLETLRKKGKAVSDSAFGL